MGRIPENSGSTLQTGSSTDIFPSSTRFMNAVVVNSLVRDARSKSVSALTGRAFVSGSKNPTATSCTIVPCCQITNCAAGVIVPIAWERIESALEKSIIAVVLLSNYFEQTYVLVIYVETKLAIQL